MSYPRIVSLIVIFALISTACAPFNKQQDTLPNRTFSTVALVSPLDIVEVATPETGTERMLQGASVGSAGVGLGGMLVGAAACGPYLYGLCVVGIGMAGMMAGGIGGALYGFSGMSADDSMKLEQRMTVLMQERNLQSDLIAKLRAELPAAMLAEPDVADVQVIMSFERFEFSSVGDAVRMEAKVRLQYATDGSDQRPEEGFRSFKVRSGESQLDDWLAADNTALVDAIDECIDLAAHDMETLLRELWTPQN